MLKKYLHKNFFLIFSLDIVLLIAALYLAYLIRFDLNTTKAYQEIIQSTSLLIIITQLVCFLFFDLYRGMWRFTGVKDLTNIIKASALSFIMVAAFFLFTHKFEGFSRSVFIIDLILTIIFIASFRLSLRLYFEYFNKKNHQFKKEKRKKIIIIGAGEAGEKLLREINNNPALGYEILGFVDDRQDKIGKKIHGISVLANIENLVNIIVQKKIDLIIIAMPSLTSGQMKTIVAACKKTNIEFKIIPALNEIIDGKINLKTIRKVAYEDLLGREEVKIDSEKIGAYLKNKCVLVTGAGGSIGSELCKQIAHYNPEKLILFEIAETPLYSIDMDLKEKFPYLEIIPVIGDIKDKKHLKSVFAKYSPSVIFHAAAYKHVPMMELFTWKAIENNVLGTKRLVSCAVESKVDKFILVSTDKAVNPTSVMGATKRIAEIILQIFYQKKENKTKFITVRFGNVLGSAGSVIPLFEKQIKKGGPVTITHPDINRYFMTITEACLLILQAGSIGNSSEIFMLDMGKPKKILDLAKEMINFYGFELGKDIKIKYIGLRPGEKLYEELNISNKEKIRITTHKKINSLVFKLANGEKEIKNIDELINIFTTYNKEKIKKVIKKIVPEYKI